MVKEDNEIIDLYWQKDEQAITETDRKYKRYLMKISHNILSSEEDCEENLSDTYLKTWNSLPPERPAVLSLFLGKITRTGAIDRWRRNHAMKRGSSEFDVCLEEIGDLVSGKEEVDEKILADELGKIINRWMSGLPQEKRIIFTGRYYYTDSIKEIAEYTGQTQASVKVILHRLRQNLKQVLAKEGYTL